MEFSLLTVTSTIATELHRDRLSHENGNDDDNDGNGSGEDEFTTKNWWQSINDYSMGLHNDSLSLDRPHLRNSMLNVYPLVILAYSLLCLIGILLNSVLIYVIVRNRYFKDATYTYLLNMCAADIVKCFFVIPISLFNMLLQNWIFGAFLCYFLPMLQDVPTHVTMLSMLMIALDRYNFLKYPSRPRLPGLIFSTGAWLTAMCVVLPYTIYTTYIDLKTHLPPARMETVGLCMFGLEKDLREYTKAVFIALFVLPCLAMIYLFADMSQILETQEETIVVHGYEIRLRGSFRRYYRSLKSFRDKRRKRDAGNHFEDDYLDGEEIDPKEEEKRLHKYLVVTIVLFAICSGSLSLLTMIHMKSVETYDNSHQWDILFVIIVWIGFFPVITNPTLMLCMIMSKEDVKEIKEFLLMQKRKPIQHESLEEEMNAYSYGFSSRPSATTISTDFGLIQERRQSSS